MIALAAALKSLGAWLWSNVLDPRFWAVAVIIASGGFVRGCAFEAEHFKEWREMAARVGEAQEAWSKKRDAAGKIANKEVVDALIKGQQNLVRDNDALHVRLQQRADRSVLSGTAASSDGGSFGDLICVARDRFDAEARGYFAGRAERLARDHEALINMRLALTACLQWDDAQRAVSAACPNASDCAAAAGSPPQ